MLPLLQLPGRPNPLRRRVSGAPGVVFVSINFFTTIYLWLSYGLLLWADFLFRIGRVNAY